MRRGFPRLLHPCSTCLSKHCLPGMGDPSFCLPSTLYGVTGHVIILEDRIQRVQGTIWWYHHGTLHRILPGQHNVTTRVHRTGHTSNQLLSMGGSRDEADVTIHSKCVCPCRHYTRGQRISTPLIVIPQYNGRGICRQNPGGQQILGYHQPNSRGHP